MKTNKFLSPQNIHTGKCCVVKYAKYNSTSSLCTKLCSLNCGYPF